MKERPKLELKIIKCLLWGDKQDHIFIRLTDKSFNDENLGFIFIIARKIWKKTGQVDLSSVFEQIQTNFSIYYGQLKEMQLFDALLENEENFNLNTLYLVSELEEIIGKKELRKKFDHLSEKIEKGDLMDYRNEIGELVNLIPNRNDTIKSTNEFEDELYSLVRNETQDYIKTQYSQLNVLLGGGYRSGLYFLGAVTKCGKTCFGKNVGYGVGNNKEERTFYLNFEMDKREMNARLISMDSGISIKAVLANNKDQNTKNSVIQSINHLKKLHDDKWFVVVNQHSRHIDDVIFTMQKMVDSYNFRFIVIDTFDKLSHGSDDSYFGFSKNVLKLEDFALRNDVTVLALKQMRVPKTKWVTRENSAGETKSYQKTLTTREIKCQKPKASDSFGTSEPERTASGFIVMFWDDDNSKIVHVVEECERYGKIGMVDFYFRKDTETYTEIENSLFKG